MPVLLSLLAGLAALVSYRVLEEWSARTWLPATLRASAWGTVALLLLNTSCPVDRPAGRPLVLLDASLSMQAAGGRWDEALALGRRSGEVRLIGVPPGDTTPSAGRSLLAPAALAARQTGRRVILLTDGEAEDADELSAEALQGPEIRVLPRTEVPDLAVTRVEGSHRLTPSDSVRVEVEIQGPPPSGGPAREVELVVREGARVWLRTRATLDPGGRGIARLQGPLPAGLAPGPHLLTVGILNAADAEPRDDARLLLLTVVPTPGIVLLASPPTWESRFLLGALQATSALPVRGYLQAEAGQWRRASDLRPVPLAEVAEAVRRADLLVSVGSGIELARTTRARGRWEWPGAAARRGLGGDWYVASVPSTPLSGAFATLALDSFPPGTAVSELSPGVRDWIGLTAQASRRGTVRPVLIGRDSARIRRVFMGIDGLWRWAFRGGSSEQGYRSLVASTVSWLLGGNDSATGRARVQREVVQRGRPAVFVWNGAGPAVPLAIGLTGPGGDRRDTLLFDGAGKAEVLLSPGEWRYRLEGGGQGALAVEEYSDEWVPRHPTLADRPGTASDAHAHVPVRGWAWLFGLAVASFAGEWYARRRLGLR